MSESGAPSGPAVPLGTRERGWWRLIIAIALLLLVPMTPILRILLPVDQTVVLLAPALAGCALVGWWAGGRFGLALVWTLLAGWILWRFASGQGTVALLTCGWAVMLSTVFGSVGLLRTGGDLAQRAFFPRALVAIGVTCLLFLMVAVVVPSGPTVVLEAVRAEVARRADAALTGWHQTTSTKEWVDLITRYPDAGNVSKQMESQLQGTPSFALVLFPSMLALESLAALTVAWALYHRVGRARLGLPLAALREFRFNDQLVWGIVAGFVLVLVPWFTSLSSMGANLLVFFATIYALRGLGVALWFLAPGRMLMTILIGFSLFFWHVLGVMALGLGLGDTWLDWRTRARKRAAQK